MKVLEVNPGFRVDKIVTMDVALPWVDDAKIKANQSIFFSNLIDRLKQLPGVRNVGATSGLPMDGGLPDGMFLLVSQNEIPKTTDGLGAMFQQKERIGNADFCVATDGYFQVLGIPLIRGRIFDERDGANPSHVAVISESLARDRWPNQDPIGHTIEFGNMDGDLRLLTIFGVVALLLATAGVFGVMAYSVSRRTREIGVRVALGAASGDVLRMILSQGLRTIFIGVAIGIAGSLALTRTVESLLFGVTATDPLTFGGVTLLLVGVALLACFIPARRATKVDPMVALRYE